MKAFPFLAILTLATLLASCHAGHQTHADTTTTEKHPASHSGHWGYEGMAAPEHWSELSAEFVKCAEGHFQSPIDIGSYAAKEHPGSILQFNYHPSPVDLVNNGHSEQANLKAENTVVANGHAYSLKQFHFHSPSEHQVDGIVYPMEMHLVHSDEDGKLAVIGVFIKEGKENVYLENLWEALPEHAEEHAHPQGPCDVLHLLPAEKTVFHYSGSLTTPPCSEGVEWFVMKQPITLSKEQIEKFEKLYHGNNRPVQAQEARAVEVIGN
ncbi:MAG TPA: carbonic anhydrase family protein [Bacteroidetes bacterium]|nr:carbonic anhydrase family protein [Bacteroidota bacterium]